MPSPSLITEVCRARPLLGTRVEIRAAAPWPAERLHAALDAAFAAVERVQALMSFHDPASELSLLNREAARRPVRIDPQTYAVLEAALELSRRSGGAFDVTVGAQLQRWAHLPGGGCLPQSSASWRDIELLPEQQVRFHQPLRLDLGGIAKGYAVDGAVDALRQGGVDSALVNAGGDLRVLGPPQRVHLRHPQNPALLAHQLELRDEALVTSAAYYSRRADTSALLDPRDGRPYLGQASISVKAPRCLHADALTKVVLFAAPETAERLLAEYGACAYLQQPVAEAA